MKPPRIVVFAYSDVGHACLKLLLDRGENVVAVYTYEDGPGEAIWFPSVAKLARERGVETFTDRDLTVPAEQARLRALAPDLVFSFYYRHIIPGEILRLPKLGAFNMHGSLLPKYRGRAPVNWAVLHGEKETGPTLHVMAEKADYGDIIDQESVPIGPDDSAAVVQGRVTAAAAKVLERRIEELKAGTAPSRPQDHAKATKFGRRRPEDGRLDWTKPARELHDLVRAVSHPYPGAFTDDFGERLYVWETLVPGKTAERAAGRAATAGGRLYVACGDQQELEIVKGQFEGEPEKPGGELAERLSAKPAA